MPVTETISANALFSSKILNKQIKEYLKTLDTTNTNEELVKCIQTDFVELCNYYIAVGDQNERELVENGINNNEIYLLHYVITETFKDVALLHRDVLLQLEIAKYRNLEGSINEESINKHYLASKEELIKGIDVCSNQVEFERNAIVNSEKNSKKALEKIQHRKNPWGIYKVQFETIKKQFKDIAQVTYPLSRIIKTFSDIKKHNATFLSEVINESEGMKKQLGETIKNVKEIKESDNISDLISWIDQIIHGISKEKELQSGYTEIIESKIKTLTKNSIPVGTNNGLLLTKSIDFQSAAKKWFDFEILPFLIDLWENKLNMKSYFKHSLLNLKSSLLVEKNNNSIEAIPSQLQTLQNVHYTLSANDTTLKEIVNNIEIKFENQFQASKIFTDNSFLEVSIQSSLMQFASEQSNFFSNLKNNLNKRFTYFNNKYEKSTLFNSQSKLDASIQCINYRMFKEDNANYDSLFLNKNFIGDLFLMPRQEQEQAFSKSLEQWKNGFNKAILVTGESLSGKTTFSEYIGQKYFDKNAVFLHRNANITFGGRKFKTTNDLGEALQNVKKGIINSRILLVIDDIELWRDEQNTLLKNVRSLISYIESESDEVLVILNVTNRMQEHLDNRLRFSEAFSTTINLNKASFKEIHKAILLRHGASHKALVNKYFEPYSNNEMEQKIQKLASNLDYNIGEVLQSWTYGTSILEKNKVLYQEHDYRFRDYFNPEEIIILKYVILYKQVNEIMLKNFVGKSYDFGYKSGLKRLINTKVLLRNDEGQLYLNTVLNIDIKQILIYRGTLK